MSQQFQEQRGAQKPIRAGFTLIEMMVSVSIFAMVMLVSTGALLALVDSSRKAQAQQTAFSNLDFALESMSRTIRTGTHYHCDDAILDDLDQEADCPNGDVSFAFEAADGIEDFEDDQIVYRLQNGAIERSDEGGLGSSSWFPITSSDVTITQLIFHVFGSSPAANQQPIVQIIVKGSAGVNDKAKVEFAFQTSVTQRLFDIAD